LADIVKIQMILQFAAYVWHVQNQVDAHRPHGIGWADP